MAKPRPKTTETLARNLNFLMAKYDYSERDIEKRSGVSAKTVNNMRNAKHTGTIQNADKIAAVFGLDGWQLIIPGLPESLLESPALRNTVENNAAVDPDGRAAIQRVAEREALYSSDKKTG